nr:RNA-directed DNA polymerase, eukaryota, reverse transcriptase zinc-binding domain protein [Tanacetum cinerariifolium]
VLDVDRLVNNICTVWVGRHKLQANIPRFQKKPLKRHSSLHNIDGVKMCNSGDTYNSNGVKGVANSYAHVVKGSQNSKMDSDSSPVMVLDDSCLNEKDYTLCLMGKVKDFATLANLKVVVANEGFDNIKFKYMGSGAELSSKKSVWVKWKYALASKDKGGLGVSSLFALNRALMFKWEVEMFKSRGIDLVSLIHSKLGNRANMSFWEVAWRGGSPFKSHFPRGGVELQQFKHMKEKVEGCILADMMDKWFWALKGSGEFTITSVRKMIDDFMLLEVSSKTCLIKVDPIKVNVHARKVKLDGLPTRLNISRR